MHLPGSSQTLQLPLPPGPPRPDHSSPPGSTKLSPDPPGHAGDHPGPHPPLTPAPWGRLAYTQVNTRGQAERKPRAGMLGKRLQGREHGEAQSGELVSGGNREEDGENAEERTVCPEAAGTVPIQQSTANPSPSARMTKIASRSECACQPRIRGFQPHRMNFHVGKCQGPEANPEDERNREGAEWSLGSALECGNMKGNLPQFTCPQCSTAPLPTPWQKGERKCKTTSCCRLHRGEGGPVGGRIPGRMRTTVEQ